MSLSLPSQLNQVATIQPGSSAGVCHVVSIHTLDCASALTPRFFQRSQPSSGSTVGCLECILVYSLTYKGSSNLCFIVQSSWPCLPQTACDAHPLVLCGWSFWTFSSLLMAANVYPTDSALQSPASDNSSPMTVHSLPYDSSAMPQMYPYSSGLVPAPPLRAKRRQVKNACTKCQKACKKCDDCRPCLRCVRYGIADECVDSQRKERKKGIKRGPYKKRDAKGAFPSYSAFLLQ